MWPCANNPFLILIQLLHACSSHCGSYIVFLLPPPEENDVTNLCYRSLDTSVLIVIESDSDSTSPFCLVSSSGRRLISQSFLKTFSRDLICWKKRGRFCPTYEIKSKEPISAVAHSLQHATCSIYSIHVYLAMFMGQLFMWIAVILNIKQDYDNY